jgi:hypothetical protein
VIVALTVAEPIAVAEPMTVTEPVAVAVVVDEP